MEVPTKFLIIWKSDTCNVNQTEDSFFEQVCDNTEGKRGGPIQGPKEERLQGPRDRPLDRRLDRPIGGTLYVARHRVSGALGAIIAVPFCQTFFAAP